MSPRLSANRLNSSGKVLEMMLLCTRRYGLVASRWMPLDCVWLSLSKTPLRDPDLISPRVAFPVCAPAAPPVVAAVAAAEDAEDTPCES